MLQIQNLTAGYDGNEVLHDISMHVSPGEIIGLIGPNGAGKSTILRTIFQLAQIKNGAIVYREARPPEARRPSLRISKGNIDITRLRTHDLLKLGIGFVPQGRLVFSNLTVEENLRMGGFLLNSRKAVEKNLSGVLTHFPVLKEKLAEKAHNLSGGQQQMLAIGRALMMAPQLLLLDEPSLGLSPKVIQEIFTILKKINAAGTTLIIVEQNVHLLLKFATRLYVLASGRVVSEGAPETFHDPLKLRKLYFQET